MLTPVEKLDIKNSFGYILNRLDHFSYGVDENRSQEDMDRFINDLSQYLERKTKLRDAQVKEIVYKAVSNCSDLREILRYADELADMVNAINRKAVDRKIKLSPAKTGSYNCCSCGCAFSGSDGRIFKLELGDPYDHHDERSGGPAGVYICLDCLEAMSDMVQDLFNEL